ncbi:hypothetical protein SEA_MORTYSMITH_7 [Microbacterium phage MortySmith]|nr:hypothetical protein SEA_AESIR_7 [Microbacterium phage Aesir]WNM68216.1 hypothetical protein SEA_JDAWG_8 [Microbacterium phage JDawG]
MSGKQNGLKRNMGVKKVRDKEAERRIRFTRPEGSADPIGRTQSAGAGNNGHTMAPKRWEERRNER